MITLLLCIAISGTLNFDGLTLTVILNWFNRHPFLFFVALTEFITFNIVLSIAKTQEK